MHGIGVYYHDYNNYCYVPRACVFDLDFKVSQVIKTSTYGSLYNADKFAFGSNGCHNNWAKGFYTEGAELIDVCLNRVRRETERCNSLEGYQIFQSLGGGNGSGMGTLLVSKLR